MLVSSWTADEAAFVSECGAGENRIGLEGRCCYGMYSSEPDSQGEAVGEWLRGVFEDRQHVGASADVYGVRACGVLRLFSEQACDETFS